MKCVCLKKLFFLSSIVFCSLTELALSTSLTSAPTVQLAKFQDVQSVILAAGQGTRFKTDTSKLIIPICGQPMVLYVTKLMEQLSIPMTVIVGYQKELVCAAIEQAGTKDVTFVEQKELLGTGHALFVSKDTWNAENILVVNGDGPLITSEIIKALYDAHIKNDATVSFVTSYDLDPASCFGRVVRSGNHVKIVEKRHFTGDFKDSPEVNDGVYIFKRSFLEKYLGNLKANSTGVKKEYYITELIEIASDNGLTVITVPMPMEKLYGANNFEELVRVEHIKHNEFIHALMAQGVRFTMPESVHIDYNVTIGRGTVIEGAAHLLNGTTIGEFCTVKPFVVLDHVTLEDKVTIGAQSVLEYVTVSKGKTVAPFSFIK